MSSSPMEASPTGEAMECPTIGVFDSGVGGLTVARAMLEALPGIRLLYLADTAHVPYGGRPLSQVQDFALQIIDFLFVQGAEAVIMGCNMSAASGAHTVAESRYDQPIFELIGPGSQAALAATRNGRIGIMATQGTVNSGAYGRTLASLGEAEVLEQACPAFVPLVEQGRSDGPEVEEAIACALTPLRDAGVDTAVFGCTHYPFLRESIRQFLGEDVTLVDPAEHVVQRVKRHFASRLAACPASASAHRFFCSGDPESLRREGERFLGLPLMQVEHVDVPVENCGIIV